MIENAEAVPTEESKHFRSANSLSIVDKCVRLVQWFHRNVFCIICLFILERFSFFRITYQLLHKWNCHCIILGIHSPTRYNTKLLNFFV